MTPDTSCEQAATGSAGGKVILLGEHSVVHGHPALAASLAIGVSAQVISGAPLDESELHVSPWGLVFRADDEDQPLALAFAALLGTYPEASEVALRVNLEVGIPGGAGLGCSAAMGVATCAALDAYFGITRSAEERGRHTLVWERVFHGNPSGVDNMVSACGGVLRFVRGEALTRVDLARTLPLVVAHSGESSSTKEVVAMVASQLEAEPVRVTGLFNAISDLIEDAEAALAAGDLDKLGEAMNANQDLARELRLSTPRIEALCEAARNAGALGAKLTGAGAGGCVIALASDRESAQRVEAAMAPLASMSFCTEAGSR